MLQVLSQKRQVDMKIADFHDFIKFSAKRQLLLYPQHMKYAMGVYSFFLSFLCDCLSVSLLTIILCQRYLWNYFT